MCLFYRHDLAVALDILLKDLKVFAQSNEQLYKEMTLLLTMDDFRSGLDYDDIFTYKCGKILVSSTNYLWN